MRRKLIEEYELFEFIVSNKKIVLCQDSLKKRNEPD